jgi:hypothetical protein
MGPVSNPDSTELHKVWRSNTVHKVTKFVSSEKVTKFEQNTMYKKKRNYRFIAIIMHLHLRSK